MISAKMQNLSGLQWGFIQVVHQRNVSKKRQATINVSNPCVCITSNTSDLCNPATNSSVRQCVDPSREKGPRLCVLDELCVCNSISMLVDVLCHIVALCYVISALCATWVLDMVTQPSWDMHSLGPWIAAQH